MRQSTGQNFLFPGITPNNRQKYRQTHILGQRFFGSHIDDFSETMAISFITDKNKVKEKTREYSQHNRRNAAQQLMTIIEYKGETDQALRGDNPPGGKGAKNEREKCETEKITFERIDRYELQYSREDKQNSQQTFRYIQNFPAHLPTNKNGRTSVILPIRQPPKRGSTTRNR